MAGRTSVRRSVRAVGWVLVVPLILLGLAGPAAAAGGGVTAQAVGPDLAVTISSPDLLPYGDSAHITYTVTNVGDAPSTPAVLQVTQYPQESGALASGCESTGPSDPAQCPVATLAAGGSVSFMFLARPPDSAWGGSGTVTGTLTPSDANPANDSATRVIQFAGPTTFSTSLVGPGPTVTAGSTIRLRVTITNTGQNPGVTPLSCPSTRPSNP